MKENGRGGGEKAKERGKKTHTDRRLSFHFFSPQFCEYTMLLGNLPQKPKDTVENLLAARFQKIPIMSYEMIFVFVEMITAVFK